MTRFVLDCSVAMSWCFRGEGGRRSESILASLAANDAVVPGIWPLEVANVLTIAERHKQLTATDIIKFLDLLASLPITVDDQTVKKAFGEVLRLARMNRLTAYDAAYLELALRVGRPLASLDTGLNKAAAALGITLYSG